MATLCQTSTATAKEGPPMSATNSRRPRGTLSRDQVLRAALAVADREGLAELTMAGVANELGVPGASVYRHASGRADLIAGLADVVLAGWEIPDPEPDPIRAFAAAQRSLREVLRPHPAAQAVVGAQGIATEARRPHLERTCAILEAAGLRPAMALVLALRLTAATAGLLVAEQTIFGTPQEAERGEGLRRMRGHLMTLDPREYPALARAADDLAEPLDPEAVFETGLALISAGLAQEAEPGGALVGTTRARRRSPSGARD
jgi:AcrR family transcriptional regulator